MNRVCLIGRLTKDTGLTATPNGVLTTKNTLAVNRTFTNANGEREADFINIVAWRNTAEFMCNYANKGSLIGVEGSVQTRNYTDKEGNKVYVTEILVEKVDLLEKKQSNQTAAVEPAQETSNTSDPFAEFGNEIDIDDNFLD